MPALSSGMLFVILGGAGLVLVLTAAVIVHRRLDRAEKWLREQIWQEYR